MTRARLAGLVLAGGASTRFGRDKLLAEVEGGPLVLRAVRALGSVCDGPVVVASADGVSRDGLGLRQVPDLVADLGPLAAIGAGLLELGDEASAVAVVAGDSLTPDELLLAWLAVRRGDAACAVLEVDGWLQPLHAVWSCDVADDVATAVEAGEASPTRWLAGRDDVVVVAQAEAAAAGFDPVAAVRDVDVPGDLPGDVAPES